MIKNDKNIYNDTQNPFSLAFGREPFEVVSRTAQTQKVIDAFERGDGGSQAYIITGLRGAGKTVLLTEISRRFDAMDDWQTVDLNPNREMLSTLISKLSSTSSLKEVFSSLKVSINIPGVSISFGGKDTIDVSHYKTIYYHYSGMIPSFREDGTPLRFADWEKGGLVGSTNMYLEEDFGFTLKSASEEFEAIYYVVTIEDESGEDYNSEITKIPLSQNA